MFDIYRDAKMSLSGLGRTANGPSMSASPGKVVIDGTSKSLMDNEDVQEFYLGAAGQDGETKSYRDVKHYKRRKRWLS